jgi:GT2 family glycosyltransferase
MHRSGTSATTGILSFFDAFLGDELIPPNEENPKGFFENRKILELNKAILEQQQSDWDDYQFNFDTLARNDIKRWVDQAKEILVKEFKYVNSFIMKDPRLCLLFPIWEAALTALNVEIKVITPHRSPLEVAHSLKHRNGFSIEKSILLWANYTFYLEKFSRKQDRLFLLFPNDFTQPKRLVNQIKQFTTLSISEHRLKQAHSFFETKLNHQHFPFNQISNSLPTYIRQTIHAIEQNDFDNPTLFDALHEDYKQSIETITTPEIHHLFAERPVLENTIKKREKTIAEREEAIQVREAMIREREGTIQQRDEAINTLNEKIATLQDSTRVLEEDYKKKLNLLKDSKVILQNNHNKRVKSLQESRTLVEKNHNNKTLLLNNEIHNFKTAFRLLKLSTVKFNRSTLQKNKFKRLYAHLKHQKLIQKKTHLEHTLHEIGIENISRFSEATYLNINKDIAKSVTQGRFDSALEHYIRFGYEEIRKGKRKQLPNAYGYQELHLKIEQPVEEKAQENKPLCKKLYSEISAQPETLLPSLKQYTVEYDILVSIIILNRDGLPYLEKLFPALAKNTPNIPYEVIIVDNDSSDNSLYYIKENKYKLPLRVIENQTNESFSQANNKAVKQAKGYYVLLANNDIEPLKNWLAELIILAETEKNVGSVGARLVYPYKEAFANSCQIQHAGIAFNNEADFFRPYNMGKGHQYDEPSYTITQKRAALTAACLLIKKEIYEEVNGLDERYIYGYEDVDLGLKLLQHGYNNYYTPNSVAFHYEFGTQEMNHNDEVTDRRQSNINIFRQKWFSYLKQAYWTEKLSTENDTALLFTETPLTVAIAVTDAGENVSAGDYFTAQELASSLETFGWKVVYRSKLRDEWYTLSDDIDVLITLLDAYDLTQLPPRSKKLISIAWARNWFDKWCDNPSYQAYDLVCASSLNACDYMQQRHPKKVHLLPIASNPKRFLAKPEYLDNKKYQCDICFTGSYWNHQRDIMTHLSQEMLNRYTVHIYGANWEKFTKFKPHYQGFVDYQAMPFVYHNAKIAIDDANHVTKPYGSVNSRVFDALLSGTLVITNGILGSNELFNGELPYYETTEQLDDLLNHYLNNETAYKEKIESLQAFILEQHTYQHRADSLRALLQKQLQQPSISLKIPAPNWEVCHQWGDYHMGVLLKEQLETLHYTVHLHMLEQWQSADANACDISIVFRGLSRHQTQSHQLNIMWNISHPDKVTLDEYETYDHVFIASEYWAEHIQQHISTPVTPLLQCTDPKRFKPLGAETSNIIQHQVLFIGNSRKVQRKILADLLPTDLDLSVYGGDWEGLINKQYIKGRYIDNAQLYQYYATTTVLLNDHWDDMKEKGFVSNRLYDALACGAFIVSDEVKGMGEIARYIKTYRTKDELDTIIRQRLENPEKDQQMLRDGMKYVLEHHTFTSRANVFSDIITKYYAKQKTSCI